MRLRDFIFVRLLMTIPMTLVLLTMVFLIMHVVPGDPVVAMMGSKAVSEEQMAIIRHTLGLDRPLYVQYLDYMAGLFRGDLGYSLARNSPVVSEIMNYLPATLELAFWSMSIAIPLGVYLGIYAAKREGTKLDSLIRIGSLVRWCVAVFWLGTMLQVAVVLYFPAFPISDRISPQYYALNKITGLYVVDSLLAGNIPALFDSLKHLALPSIVLGTMMAASLTKITRANVVEVLREEYIRVARLKGCSENAVFRRHALPNALIPILTYAGLETAILMQGAILTETVFSWSGLGRLLLLAVSYRDFNLVQGTVVFFALMMSLVNLIVDVLYGIVDPRIRY